LFIRRKQEGEPREEAKSKEKALKWFQSLTKGSIEYPKMVKERILERSQI
jgi:hypothetical protein